MHDVLYAVAVLCAISGALAALLLVAEHFLADYGECTIDVNQGERRFTVTGGGDLLSNLGEQKLFLPSACGGRGSCGLCKCRILAGGGPVLPTELPYLTEDEQARDVRLACQVKVKRDLEVQVPQELLSVREFTATVERIEDLTHDIKLFRFALDGDERIRFRAGQYVQLVVPPYDEVREETFRAYSIASPPSDDGAVDLVIRLVPNGIVTTYCFEHLREGDTARLTGPFGEFRLHESDRECLFIAGGSGLAPFRSMVLDMIEHENTRKATFYFGAVEEKDLYYVDFFSKLAAEHDWFSYVPALSGAAEGHGYETGLVTEVVGRHYESLDNHEAYLCGSPGMIDACIKVLADKGLDDERVFYDKFS